MEHNHTTCMMCHRVWWICLGENARTKSILRKNQKQYHQWFYAQTFSYFALYEFNFSSFIFYFFVQELLFFKWLYYSIYKFYLLFKSALSIPILIKFRYCWEWQNSYFKLDDFCCVVFNMYYCGFYYKMFLYNKQMI